MALDDPNASPNPRAPQLRRLVADGYSDAQIAARFNVSAKSVTRWRRSAGLRSLWTPPPAEHGERSRYTAGCRCEACKAANTAYAALTRAVHKRARQTRAQARQRRA